MDTVTQNMDIALRMWSWYSNKTHEYSILKVTCI